MLSDQHYIHNASSLYLVTRTSLEGSLFSSILQMNYSTGMAQIGCLLAGNWKAQSLSSKSLMWHETEYLPAGVTLWPCLGLWGLLRPAKPRVPLRNVAQTWLQFSPHHTEMFGLSYSYKSTTVWCIHISWSLCQALADDVRQTHRGVDHVKAAMVWGQRLHPIKMAAGR